jgi:hypothetical protein
LCDRLHPDAGRNHVSPELTQNLGKKKGSKSASFCFQFCSEVAPGPTEAEERGGKLGVGGGPYIHKTCVVGPTCSLRRPAAPCTSTSESSRLPESRAHVPHCVRLRGSRLQGEAHDDRRDAKPHRSAATKHPTAVDSNTAARRRIFAAASAYSATVRRLATWRGFSSLQQPSAPAALLQPSAAAETERGLSQSGSLEQPDLPGFGEQDGGSRPPDGRTYGLER